MIPEEIVTQLGLIFGIVALGALDVWTFFAQRKSAAGRRDLLEIHDLAERLGVKNQLAKAIASPEGAAALGCVVGCGQCQDVCRCHQLLDAGSLDIEQLKKFCPNIEFLFALRKKYSMPHGQ